MFALERRIYRIDTLRLNPSGVPLRGIVYAAALVVAALVAGALPPTALARSARAVVPARHRRCRSRSRGCWDPRGSTGGAFHVAALAALDAPRRAAHGSTASRRAPRAAPLAPAADRAASPTGPTPAFGRCATAVPGAVLVRRPHLRREWSRPRRRAMSRCIRSRGRAAAARACSSSPTGRRARGPRALMSWRRPLSFVYGNCLFGSSGPWALFALEPHGYATLTVERKRRALRRAARRDRGGRGRRPAAARARALGRGSASSASCVAATRARTGDCTRATWTAQLAGLRDERAEPPAIYLAVSLEPPQRDVGAFVAGLAERAPRELVGAGPVGAARRASARRLSAAELERLRARADEMHARLVGVPRRAGRRARSSSSGSCGARSAARSASPRSTACTSRRHSCSSATARAMLAPLEADVMRWSESYVEQPRPHAADRVGARRQLAGASRRPARCRSARRSASHAARADVRARPRRSRSAIDLSLCARYLPNELAMRLVRRRVQDADEIARAEAGGDQGVSDRGYDRTQDARDLLAYLQSASHPPLLRATLAVAVAADDERGARAPRRDRAARLRRGPPAPAARRSAAALRRTLPGQRTPRARATTTCSPPSRSRR